MNNVLAQEPSAKRDHEEMEVKQVINDKGNINTNIIHSGCKRKELMASSAEMRH